MQQHLFSNSAGKVPQVDLTKINLEASWKNVLKEEFSKPYFGEIKAIIKKDMAAGISIFPKGSEIFSAFNLCPFNEVKVVILGQDPYHGPGQAHGLCFSVQYGVKVPPSLQNIYKELHKDIGMEIPKHGFLESWAKQGVFMLNAILTVKARQAASHQKIGWQQFTDAVIHQLSAQQTGLVFLLWGKFAQSKIPLIDANKHLILTAAHPSPFSAHNGFFGCQHFSKTNEYLAKQGKPPIDWQV